MRPPGSLGKPWLLTFSPCRLTSSMYLISRSPLMLCLCLLLCPGLVGLQNAQSLACFRIETPRPHARLFDSTTNISTSDSTLPSSFDDVEQMLQSIGLVNDRSSSLSISVGSSSSSLDAVEQLLTTPRLEESSACVSLRACPPDAPSYTYPSSLCLPVSPNDNHAESFSACGETLQLPMATCSPVAFTTPSSPVMQAHCPSQGKHYAIKRFNPGAACIWILSSRACLRTRRSHGLGRTILPIAGLDILLL